MSKLLVIVESPTKARTLGKILGDHYIIESSMGHVVDLPVKNLGLNIDDNFEPKYVVIKGKAKIIQLLKKHAKEADKIYLATDPDREGEAISWHLKNKISTKINNNRFFRVTFHEITKEAVKDAFKHPGSIDLKKVNAQIARRVLDRIVGYLLSPLLWKKVGTGMSAGRVQSVALKFIVEREREIDKFIPEEYWDIEAELKKQSKKTKRHFIARLDKIDNNKAEIKTAKVAEEIISDLAGKTYKVIDIQSRETKKSPLPPFTTSSLQQDAFNKLGFNTNKTMIVAQQLYEGIDIGKEGPVGLITYMRTDSVHIAASALNDIRAFIEAEFGKEYLPETPNVYKSKKSAQEAHEAIRPAYEKRRPDSIKEFLTNEQYKLYKLIWERSTASQMVPARFLINTAKIAAGKYTFSASGSTLIFKGYTAVYSEDRQMKAEKSLPELSVDEILDLIQLTPNQHFTKPPGRYSEASLVKALEEKGIGRPSTYAPIIRTIVYRNYVSRHKGYFAPTDLGIIVNDMLIEYFPKIIDEGFTADLENKLDEVEEGDQDWVTLIKEFYGPFKEWLDHAQDNIKKTNIETDKICPKCGKNLVIKWGRKGKFLSCGAFPECRYSEAFTIGLKCPQEGCTGELVERRSKKGRTFLACNRYPECTYTASNVKQAQQHIDRNNKELDKSNNQEPDKSDE